MINTVQSCFSNLELTLRHVITAQYLAKVFMIEKRGMCAIRMISISDTTVFRLYLEIMHEL